MTTDNYRLLFTQRLVSVIFAATSFLEGYEPSVILRSEALHRRKNLRLQALKTILSQNLNPDAYRR
jgi:hypothetical protein